MIHASTQADLFDALAGSAMVVAMAILFGVCMWADRNAAVPHELEQAPFDDDVLGGTFTPPRAAPPAFLLDDFDDEADVRIRAICSAGSHTWQEIQGCVTCGSTRRVPERLRSGAAGR